MSKKFLKHAKSVSNLNALILKERMGVGHFLLLTEIVARRIKGKSLPNVKWLQTELRISFTKVKSIIESLESRGLITKISDPCDKRRKFLDVTDEGHNYIKELTLSVEQYSPKHSIKKSISKF
ncbi:MarR family winged helix-turn-helix transcriptional regulator [Gammaproteobacteria bacterium]|nr:MarR family winged helix-turn-helix transcriptional regulator [Gammaproteobacteria bacterium]